jgi:hypothetical protein
MAVYQAVSPRMSAMAIATVLLLLVSMDVGQVHARELTEDAPAPAPAQACSLTAILQSLLQPCGLVPQVGAAVGGIVTIPLPLVGSLTHPSSQCCTAAEGILVNVLPAPPCCLQSEHILALEVVLGVKLSGLLDICLGTFKIPVCL